MGPKLIWRIGALIAILAAPCVSAQTTDGYHTILVFPVVVESGSFTQRFTFHIPQGNEATPVAATFHPHLGAAATAPVACGSFVIPASGNISISSLRILCPDIPPGSTFGFLHTQETSPLNLPYAGFSRVSNPAGNGFSVEAFPPHTFTSANSVVTGARRLAATASSPAFQTNCFVANLNDVTSPAQPLPTQVLVSLFDQANVQTAGSAVALFPGEMIRLLDVFSAIGAPAGDIDNATIRFQPIVRGAGLISFCTVQDNTSFGADFRIGKQERSFMASGRYAVAGHDDHVIRRTFPSTDLKMSGDAGRQFMLGATTSANTHLVYFRHPDRIQCELMDLPTSQRLTPEQGLEMRLLAADGTTVIAGGNDITGFGEIYLGDKSDLNGGANGRYTIEVEHNESAVPGAGDFFSYQLHCQSGSGHTQTEIIRFQQSVDRF